uniref:ATP-binding cassette domain-containing protein n=1 Tax=Acetatifactor sp. TaxID=1872090 RepID=UPI004057857B
MFRKGKSRKIGILLFWLLVWWVLAIAVDNPILLVSPFHAVKRLAEFVVQLAFWKSVAGSFLRIAVGFLLGILIGLALAGISFRYRWFEELLQPVISLIKTVPIASFVVILLIWWGSSVLVAAICFLVVLPNIYINTLEGLKATDAKLLEMAQVFRMAPYNRFFYIYRPALRPFWESGMKLALGMCWKSGVAAEVIGMPEYSIGGQLYLSKIHLDTAGVMAWTAAVILLSLCFEKLILRILERFFEWNPQVVKKSAQSRKQTEQQIGKEDVSKKIELIDVCKFYGEQKVLDKVTATYESGKIYYLTSPSGSGKTTLFRLLCRVEQPDRGKIVMPDKVSMVFQEDRLCEDDTAVQNVAMVTGNPQEAEKALKKLLDAEALTKPCSQLSGGMKRRVSLVRAMEARSDVVLLDEPFTGMDAETKISAEAYIRERQRGRTIMIATHVL